MNDPQTTLAAANHYRDSATQFRSEAWHYRWLPLVSVVIPTYQPDRGYLREALDSVAAQSYSNWEVCIVDDASPVRVAEAVIRPFAAAHDGRVHFRRLPVNAHISGASNACIELATGDYIALLDHDDRLFPDALENMVRRINTFRDEYGRGPEILYSDEEQIDELGSPIPGEAFFKPDWSPELHRRVNYTTHLSVYSRPLLNRIGGFREGYEGSQDYDLMLRAVRAAETPVQHIPELLYQWRAHSSSTAQALGNKSYAADAGVAAVQDDLDARGVPAVVRFDTSIARNHVRMLLPDPPPSVTVVVFSDASDAAPVPNSLDAREYPFPVNLVLADASHDWASGLNEAGPDDVVVLVGARYEPVEAQWLTNLVGLAAAPGVGVVGGLVVGLDGRIQSAGLTIDAQGTWVPRARGEMRESLLYKHTLRVVHEVLCPDVGVVAVRAAQLDEVLKSTPTPTTIEGLIEALSARARDRGLSNVASPDVAVSTSRSGSPMIGRSAGVSVDPYMNPHLAKDGSFEPSASRHRPAFTSSVLNELLRPVLVVQGAGLAAPSSPAAFDKWAARPQLARWTGFPDKWTVIPDLRFADPARVGVVLHVFYPELVSEIIERLAAMPVPFDLLVTNSSGMALQIDTSGLAQLRNHIVLEMPNHGRDIYPLVSLVNADLLAPYDVVLKVHTKKSAWRADHGLGGDGASWRGELLDSLMGGRAGILACLELLASDPAVGFVTAPGSVLGPEHWGDNEGIASELIRRIELPLEPQRLHFAAGSMYWVRGFLLQGLRSLNLSAADFEVEDGQVNQTTAHALERLFGRLASEAGCQVLEAPSPASWDADQGQNAELPFSGQRGAPDVRVVPFFLPQFHATPENDQWWGPGFTEWTNVTSARPIYPGHHQPKLPRDLGFYDLSHEEVAVRQERLAEEHGVSAFMYYHYWFSGRTILGAPLAARLTRTGGLPFCLMWANENWTKRWDGRDSDILLKQDHHEIPPAAFLPSITDALMHPDYLRLGDRAVLAVYRPAQVPDIARVVEDWRAEAVGSGGRCAPPPGSGCAHCLRRSRGGVSSCWFRRLMAFPPHNHDYVWMQYDEIGVRGGYAGNVLSYSETVRGAEDRLRATVDPDYLPGVMVGFDNVARRQLAGDIWYGANPFTFRRWLAASVAAVANRQNNRTVFVNAWNEWAEGAMLEPSDKFGMSYLQAIRDVAGSPIGTQGL